MCFKSFNSSVNAMVLIWLCGYLSKVSSLETTTDNPCRGEAELVCQNIGSAVDHINALISAFNKTHKIDLIFIICNTTECNKDEAYRSVITFIKNIIALASTKYNAYIDADRMHVAIIVYDNTSARLTLNDIEKSIPKVGNCEFDQFLDNRMESTEARGDRYDGLLLESLGEAKQVFGHSARPNARKILWLFSECGNCKDTSYAVETAADSIKNGYPGNVDVFTVGIRLCPGGWFATLMLEDTMKTIASTNSSHYACIAQWSEYVRMEIKAGAASQQWSDIINDADIGQNCKGCANSTSSSSYRCVCEVTSGQYTCHGFSSVNPTLAIALGAGIGGGGLLVVIIIVIIVVAARRCKKPSSPPPPVPRRFVKTPAPPPESNHPRIYGNQDLDKTPGFSLTESQTTAIDDTESIESIEYEVEDVERNMPGWSAHLLTLKRKDRTFLHLGVYSIDDEYFAQTPGFTLTESQRTALNEAMTTGNSVRNIRKKSTVIVGGTTYVIERKTREKLRARTEDKKLWLAAVSRSGYLVVGLAEAEGRDRCEEVIEDVLGAVTTSRT